MRGALAGSNFNSKLKSKIKIFKINILSYKLKVTNVRSNYIYTYFFPYVVCRKFKHIKQLKDSN